MTPEQFVARWRNTTLNERQSYQAHFIDLCHLLDVTPPGGSGTDDKGRTFQFEAGVQKEAGGQGYADVFYEGHFAVEYKAPGKHDTLADAYNQLKQYRQNLNNPPLLAVTDIEHWEIHTNFNNAAHKVYTFTHEEIKHERARRILHQMFTHPNALHPARTAEQITREAAAEFAKLTDEMRQGLIQVPAERVAHFLTKIVFCLFAEDVGLLPVASSGRGLFTEIIEETLTDPRRFMRYMRSLFKAMANGGDVMLREVRYFNGRLFDDITVEELTFEALQILQRAARVDWSSVEPAIFGTLFERSLDPAKRAQLGAHYTSPDDIMLIVEPVLMAPLRREWDAILADATATRDKYDAATDKRGKTTHRNQLEALRERMLHRLRAVTVLDPACGSGNFLYMSLRALLDLEKEVLTHPVFADVGLSQPAPEVHPRQMHGIEINPIAHDLATIVVWIGWIQWKINNGYPNYPQPVLQDLGENIKQQDAILAYDADGNPTEPDWQPVDVIVGNPPFLGGQKLVRELGKEYTAAIRTLYDDKLHASADLVTYWFERARKQIAAEKSERAGLLATQSIRKGFSRQALDNIKETGDIFMAWSDREWVLDGAAVRVSMVGFDKGEEKLKVLDGQEVKHINSDLTSSVDITQSAILSENTELSFKGVDKSGAFDIDFKIAQKMLQENNDPPNNDVVKLWFNGSDITRRPRNIWIIDFNEMERDEASKYVAPFHYVEENVKEGRSNSGEARQREYWWHFGRSRPAMREAIDGLERYIVTPRVAKYRIFTWLDKEIVPDSRLYVIARDDDYFLGVLHSKIHELWSLAQASWHGKGNDPTYNNTTCFETFPFPYPPGSEPANAPAVQRIARAARALHTERAAWLHPNDDAVRAQRQTPTSDAPLPEKRLKHRTLTNLYNALAKWRDPATYDGPKTKPDADEFAPRLDDLHRELDRAVCAAYGWDAAVLQDDEAILRHLLTLNQQRAHRG